MPLWDHSQVLGDRQGAAANDKEELDMEKRMR